MSLHPLADSLWSEFLPHAIQLPIAAGKRGRGMRFLANRLSPMNGVGGGNQRATCSQGDQRAVGQGTQLVPPGDDPMASVALFEGSLAWVLFSMSPPGRCITKGRPCPLLSTRLEHPPSSSPYRCSGGRDRAGI